MTIIIDRFVKIEEPGDDDSAEEIFAGGNDEIREENEDDEGFMQGFLGIDLNWGDLIAVLEHHPISIIRFGDSGFLIMHSSNPLSRD